MGDVGIDLYATDEYVRMNPHLFVGDSQWKISRIIPFVDKFIEFNEEASINLLDVGGGAGIILKNISAYIEENKGICVNKIALDLSPGALSTQKENNPDLRKALNEDIRNTSLRNKEIDLALVIDVLEHVPQPQRALNELRRISKYTIMKVPLEDNLYWNLANVIFHDRIRSSQRSKGPH